MPEWKRSSDKKYVKRTYNEDDYSNNDDIKNVSTFESESKNYEEPQEELQDETQNNYRMIGITSDEEEKLNPDQDDFEYNEDELEEDYDEEKKPIGKILLVIILIIAVILGVYFGYKNFTDNSKTNEVVTNTVVEENTLKSSISGYKVLGKIKIDKLSIEQYILDSTKDEALDLGVGYIDNGASINNYGNFAICGHNVEGVFMNLNELVIGDKIILIDKNLEETTYVVTSKTTVDPSNLECLLQDESKIELTLITCQTGATERLVVKAEEEDSVSSSSDLNSVTVNETNTVITNSVN